MNAKEAGAAGARKIAAALERKVRLSGLGHDVVEVLAGLEPGALRATLSGAGAPLTVEQVSAVLAAIELPPAEFYVEVYGPIPSPYYVHDDPNEHPLFRESLRLAREGALRMRIWALRKRGALTEEEAARVLAGLDEEEERDAAVAERREDGEP